MLSTLTVVSGALRLLAQHWPTLFALIFAGHAARQGLLLASVRVSELNGVLGFLVFALVPIAMLVAFVLMLAAMRPSLSGPAGTGLQPGEAGVLGHLASVLLPFLAIYASYDYFTEDRTEYFYLVLEDELLANPDIFTNPSAVNVDERLPFQLSPLLLGVVAAAVVLRAVLGRVGKQWTSLNFVRAYLEVLWISLAAAALAGLWSPIRQWLESRRMVHWATETWLSGTEQLGWFASLVRTVRDWFWELTGSVEPVILFPLAWLAIGCVIYGHVLADPPPGEAGELAEQARRRWLRLPAQVRRGVSVMTVSLRSNLRPLVNGVRLLRHAGLATMLLFCLAFVLARSVPVWLWELERLIIGPQDLGTVWMPWSGPLSLFNESVGAVLLVCLVAAAVEYVLGLQQGDGSAQEPEVDRELGDPGDPDGDRLGADGGDEQRLSAVGAQVHTG